MTERQGRFRESAVCYWSGHDWIDLNLSGTLRACRRCYKGWKKPVESKEEADEEATTDAYEDEQLNRYGGRGC